MAEPTSGCASADWSGVSGVALSGGPDSLALLLNLMGHQVHIAYSGPEALELATAVANVVLWLERRKKNDSGRRDAEARDSNEQRGAKNSRYVNECLNQGMPGSERNGRRDLDRFRE